MGHQTPRKDLTSTKKEEKIHVFIQQVNTILHVMNCFCAKHRAFARMKTIDRNFVKNRSRTAGNSSGTKSSLKVSAMTSKFNRQPKL